MTEASSGPFSLGALRAAALEGQEPPPLRSVARLKSYRWFVVGTVCIGAVMGQVDASMTQVLLPRLEVEFGARLASVSWVAVAYLLALASFMPIFGRLSDMFGRKLLYTAGFLLFIAGSALCGYATSLPANFSTSTIAFFGADGVTDAVHAWGSALLARHGAAPKVKDPSSEQLTCKCSHPPRRAAAARHLRAAHPSTHTLSPLIP